MTIHIGINGFGRIGRCVLRSLYQGIKKRDIRVVLINDLTPANTLLHLLKYDSVHGRAPFDVLPTHGGFQVDGNSIQVTAHANPAEIPWGKFGVDVVLECTGLFTKGDQCQTHIKGGAKKVLLSAPGKSVDKTIVMGVNHGEYDHAKHHIISNGSCTTNCLAPVAKIIHESFGIEKGLMTTIHSYTNDQRVLDLPHSDLRRARAAALNMIPTTTGAAQALGEVIPALAGKLHGLAVRVPTPNVSLVDVTFEVKKTTTVAEINGALEAASRGHLKSILGFSQEPLVSSDFNGDPLSSIVDAPCTQVMGGNLVKILSWYDNEWGFSNRMLDLIEIVER